MHMLYSLALKDSGHEVVFTATSGEEIVNEILSGNTSINTILMDYRMTGINGLEAAKKILKKKPAIKIIMASADDSVKDEALGAGVSRFLSKPFSLDELVDCVNAI